MSKQISTIPESDPPAASENPKSRVATIDDPVPAEKPQVAAAPVEASAVDKRLSGKKVRVMFYDQEGDLGKGSIFADLNEVAYNIPRGVPVDLPVEVLHIFNNAVYKVIETDEAAEMRETTMMRFAFQVQGLV